MRETEGERITSFLSSSFYTIHSQGFKLIGLQVSQINGNYKIEFIIENDKELIKNEKQQQRTKIEA